MQEFISQTAMNLALAVLSLMFVYATAAIKKLSTKLKLEAEMIEDEKQRALLQSARIDIEDLATKTVKQIEQTTAKTLREAVRNGTKDKSELEALAVQAFNEISKALKPDCKELIESNLGSFEEYLKKTIESKVFELKQLSR